MRFYKLFPEILSSVMTKSKARLSWTHYIILLQVDNPTVRNWYATEAAQQNWSVRTLQRNISSQYSDALLTAFYFAFCEMKNGYKMFGIDHCFLRETAYRYSLLF